MLLFVFFIAIVNLAIGYALGAGFGLSSLMQLLPQRDEKPEIADIDDATPLSRAAPVIEATAAENPATTEGEAPAAVVDKPSAINVMTSLRSFREKLNNANVELKRNQQDPAKFEESATKLQAANHDYLEEAEEAIKQLEELGAAGDTAASATCEVVSTGATELAAISHEIDDLIESGLASDEAREQLVAKSQSLSDATVEAEKSVAEVAAIEAPAAEARSTEEAPKAEQAAPVAEQASPVAHDPNSDEIDRLFDNLESLLAEAADDAVSHVAVVRIDAKSESEPDDALTQSIEDAIGVIAKELLEEAQTFVPGRPALMLLEGDTYEEALQRVELLRQQVEATTFAIGDYKVKATVTCAFTDARKGIDRDQVMRHLDEALGESNRVGGNKTFHHDGAFPTEASLATVDIEPRTIELAIAG